MSNIYGGLMAKQDKDLDWQAVEGHFDGRFSTMYATLEDGYEIEIGLQENEDRVLQCTSLSLKSPDEESFPGTILNSRYFQTLGFGDILSSARLAYGEWREVVNEVYEEIEVDRLLNEWKSFGSTEIPDKYYAAIAWKYEKFVLLGLDNPTTALADFLAPLDRATVSSRIVVARNRGLLTKPKKGTFGGKLTTKAKKALNMEAPIAKEGK
jgi:hypothetical protein